MTETSLAAGGAIEGQDIPAGKLDLALRDAGSGAWVLVLAGPWTKSERLPPAAELEGRMSATGPIRRVGFDTERLSGWDSALIVFVGQIEALAARVGADLDVSGLPEGAQRVFRLARAVPPRSASAASGAAPSRVASAPPRSTLRQRCKRYSRSLAKCSSPSFGSRPDAPASAAPTSSRTSPTAALAHCPSSR